MSLDMLSSIARNVHIVQSGDNVSQMETDTEKLEQEIQERIPSQVKMDSNRPATGVLNDNILRFNTQGEEIEARIYADNGDLIRTIPASDINEILKENYLPSIGNIINKIT